MDRFVQLAQLPPGIDFPRELQGRVWYDADQRRLYFRGFMSKADFDRLCRLSNDFQFQRALEALFQTCTFVAAEPSAPSWLAGKWLAGKAAAVAIALASAAAVGLLWLRH